MSQKGDIHLSITTSNSLEDKPCRHDLPSLGRLSTQGNDFRPNSRLQDLQLQALYLPLGAISHVSVLASHRRSIYQLRILNIS